MKHEAEPKWPPGRRNSSLQNKMATGLGSAELHRDGGGRDDKDDVLWTEETRDNGPKTPDQQGGGGVMLWACENLFVAEWIMIYGSW